MFAQPQRLRRFAAYVLLVWLFGLGAGIVNACVVHGGLSDSGHVAMHGADAGQRVSAQAQVDQAQVDQAIGDDQECDQADPPCKQLCDAPSVVPQAEKQQSNPLSGFWLACAPVPSLHLESGAEPAATIAGSHVRWRKTIPVSIAFLRLTL